MKVHSVMTARVSRFRHARFEIVTEVMARKIADNRQYFLRQCRMFGDSPKPLELARITDLVNAIVAHVCEPLARDGKIDLSDMDDVLAKASANR